MNQRTRIKICGLTREQDVDAAVEAGADAVGFVLLSARARASSPPRAPRQLARALPPFVTPVRLFVNATPPTIERGARERVPGALLQFHGDETPAAVRRRSARPYLRAARMAPERSIC